MDRRQATRYRTDVRFPHVGLWPMVAEPGPLFRWGVLLRRSSLNTVTDEHGCVRHYEDSTERQELEVVWHIREHNMGVIVDSYKDIASAWRPGAKRPRFKHALVDIAAGRIDGIACLNVDRLTRQKGQVRPILNALESMGGRLFCLEDELDTADDSPEANTELRLYQLVDRAEREARRASERMKLAIKHRARKGLPHRGGNRPFGLTGDWRGLVPEEAHLLQMAALDIDVGTETPTSIARAWTDKGIPTPVGNTFWHAKNVAKILLSPRLAAKTEHEGVLYDTPAVPAILDEALWLRVREKLTGKRRPGRRETRQLSNIALCSVCGLVLVSGLENNGAAVYVCKKRPSVPGACGSVNIRIDKLDAKVSAEVVTFLNDKPRAQALLDTHRLETPEMAAIDTRYAELQDNKVALNRAAFNPPQGVKRLPPDEYYELLAEIEREQGQLQRQRAVNRDAQPLKDALAHEWTLQAWQAEPVEWRRGIIKLVCERIEVSPVSQRGATKGHVGAVHNPDRIRVKLAG
jgi:DNA invertase Pin-like site-specific DNA recombinase